MAAPYGNTNGGKEKSWRDQIRIAVNELRDDPTSSKKIRALRLLARNTVTKAINGDMAAVQEIGNRLDGRPSQGIEHSGKVDTGIAPVDALALLLSQVDGIAGRQVDKQDDVPEDATIQ